MTVELGCAMGANLLSIAFNLPGSEFTGVDSSGRQVAAARAEAQALGLKNVRIEHGRSEFDFDQTPALDPTDPEPASEFEFDQRRRT